MLHVYEQADIQVSPFDIARVNTTLDALEARAHEQMERDGVAKARRRLAFSLDMRHKGQINEVEVLLPEARLKKGSEAKLRERFAARYEQLYGKGSSYRDARAEIVTLRLRASAATPRPDLKRARSLTRRIAPQAALGKREIWWPGLKRAVKTPVYDGAQLKPGNRVKGPTVVETTDTTIVVHPGRTLGVDAFGNFEIEFRV
jgi:N-methylhydantoinase A/oxoprolinase/acetone carboxylase beta subunit